MSAPPGARPRPDQPGYAFDRGLLASLEGLALRCAAVAIAVPLLVFLLAVGAGHRFFEGDATVATARPFVAFSLGSYVLVPMFALAGAISAAVAAVAIAASRAPLELRLGRTAFLLGAGALALAIAIAFAYDAYLLPDLLG